MKKREVRTIQEERRDAKERVHSAIKPDETLLHCCTLRSQTARIILFSLMATLLIVSIIGGIIFIEYAIIIVLILPPFATILVPRIAPEMKKKVLFTLVPILVVLIIFVLSDRYLLGSIITLITQAAIAAYLIFMAQKAKKKLKFTHCIVTDKRLLFWGEGSELIEVHREDIVKIVYIDCATAN